MNAASGGAPGRQRRAPRRGLSIVELMIGITIGLFILAGATVVMTSQIGDTRRLLLEAQVQQDVRATADLVARDLRRAAYWAQAWRNVWPASLPLALTNPYTTMTPDTAPAGTGSLVYDRSMDEADGANIGTDNNLVDNTDRTGFRYNATARTIEMLVSIGNWQTLTDPNVLEVTAFNIVLNSRNLAVPCADQCPVLGPTNCPLVQVVRDASVVISARAVHDQSVRRSVRTNLRLRNDIVREVCP